MNNIAINCTAECEMGERPTDHGKQLKKLEVTETDSAFDLLESVQPY